MARFAPLALVLLATVALAFASYNVDLSHDFLEVDPMMNEYAQLAEQGIAFTELGAELEDADADADAEAEAYAEAEAENPPVPAAASTPAPAPVAKPAPAVQKTDNKPAPAPPAPKVHNPANPQPKKIVAPEAKSQSGWTFRERGAPESVNVTDVYSIAYDRLKCKMWIPANISNNYPIKEYTYVVVSGAVTRSGYADPIVKALESYGVPRSSILSPILDYNGANLKNADSLFKQLNNTYYNVLKQQKFVIIAHSAGIVPVHALLTVQPTAASMIQGVIALNGVWGGSYLASNFEGLPDGVEKVVKSMGFNGNIARDLTYTARQHVVRAFPIDYNAVRALSVATHIEKSKDYAATIAYLKTYGKEINDGVVTLSDQIIPGGRAVMLNNLDHDDLAYASEKNAPVDTLLAAQAYIYTFFKVTP